MVTVTSGTSRVVERMEKETQRFEFDYNVYYEQEGDDPLRYKGWIMGVSGTPYEDG